MHKNYNTTYKSKLIKLYQYPFALFQRKALAIDFQTHYHAVVVVQPSVVK